MKIFQVKWKRKQTNKFLINKISKATRLRFTGHWYDGLDDKTSVIVFCKLLPFCLHFAAKSLYLLYIFKKVFLVLVYIMFMIFINAILQRIAKFLTLGKKGKQNQN